ncbi:hypothetical protein C8K38_111217 [Rhodococcus sp. OK611]|uniref:hypothetical protein n=1 Tax=unclassified Rhodococcus (in: high G+C Gram-positive bacteria) TaxID=192944 RepID=UPI000BC7AFE4|nr:MULTISPECIES: hypothetical protein [unclassified Rhodococcus (in: high G+C Gram-positive bacteria)]PTR42048.1 hypothetical protein C8K38_111217 [Rhodococcus sp. OK611]SNX91505.1 hypothetical protein SAMN05447004_11040 [Rhodococcus sp. OK270]
MARTYPARRARIAKVEDVHVLVGYGLDGAPMYNDEPSCLGCDEPVVAGDRIIGDYWGQPNGLALHHAGCADAGEALP